MKEPPPGEDVNVALCRRTNRELSGDSREVLLSSPVSQIRDGTYDRGSGVVNRALDRLELSGDESSVMSTMEADFRGIGSSSSSWESVSERSDLGESMEDHRRMAKLTGEGFIARFRKPCGRRVVWTPSVSPEELTSGFGPSESRGVFNWRESSVVELKDDSARGGGSRSVTGSSGESESGTIGTHFRRARLIGLGATPRKPLVPPFLNPRIPEIEGRRVGDARTSEASAASTEQERFTGTCSSVLGRFRDEVL